MDEQQELQQYEEDMKWIKEVKQDYHTWDRSMDEETVTTHQIRVRD